MSEWTVVVASDALGSSFPGNYQTENSTTAHYEPSTWHIVSKNSSTNEVKKEIATDSVNMGAFVFKGQRWYDQMCLKQMRYERTKASGTFCVDSQEFLLATSVDGEFNANGVVGLAPSGSSKSYVQSLKKNGQIKQAIVGINFEDPLDTDQKSIINFGSVNFEEVEGGESALNYYSNLAIGKWGLLMDDFAYNGMDLTGDHHAKIALIDSGNFSI